MTVPTAGARGSQHCLFTRQLYAGELLLFSRLHNLHELLAAKSSLLLFVCCGRSGVMIDGKSCCAGKLRGYGGSSSVHAAICDAGQRGEECIRSYPVATCMCSGSRTSVQTSMAPLSVGALINGRGACFAAARLSSLQHPVKPLLHGTNRYFIANVLWCHNCAL